MHRQFEDEVGRTWDVWEVHPSAVERRVNEERRKQDRNTPDRRQNQDIHFPMPRELAEGWLAFQSGEERLRLAPIPDGWSRMSDDELRALRGRALRPRVAPSARLRGTGTQPSASSGDSGDRQSRR